MSETEGFKMAMKLSRQEAGMDEDSDEETPVMQDKQDKQMPNMDALMSDTAGF